MNSESGEGTAGGGVSRLRGGIEVTAEGDQRAAAQRGVLDECDALVSNSAWA